ncbi:MAG: phenylalanine--tRNA ligase subunit alpha [Candidatus Cloacimonetes bacterium]|nr:phenylalanine--tRNA ligase subunit alpha [Candidatus Cloacimonadota bacterium]
MANEIKNQLLLLQEKAEKELQELEDIDLLEELHRQILGKKGKLTLFLKQIPQLPPDERVETGRLANKTKKNLESIFKEKTQSLRLSASQALSLQEQIDITVPGVQTPIGHLHPVSLAIFEIEDIFSRLGFVRRRYPEVEHEYYTFEALNMPAHHPARDDFETFYITDEIILTPHTSSGQVREMEKGSSAESAERLPIRMLNIAKCYRPQIDASHTPMFFQFEGLFLDKNVSIAELKGTLDFFAKNYFGKGSKTRLRPHHFQFTEPSFETDVTCTNCSGRGCKFCKQGWLELGGAGMVHPKVIENGGLHPKEVNGFAFGWGVERVAAIRYRIPDIRLLYQNDLRFLEQF